MTAADRYAEFLAGKRWSTYRNGFDVPTDALPEWLAPFQRDLVRFALVRGRAALFADTGLGKTRMQLAWAQQIAERTGGNVLILAPLAVAQQTVREGAGVGVAVRYCRAQADVQPGLTIANYEMLDHFNLAEFVAVVLDESSILKSHTAKTRDAIIAAFRHTPYRLACTATPAPNDHTELGNHAEFLGVMTRTEMLSTFFVHDGGDTSEWRLKGHARAEFWRWVSRWGAAIRKPSDLGYDDGAYNLPALHIRQHELGSGEAPEGALFALPARGLTEQRGVKRESLRERCERMAALVAAEPGEQWLVWCELNEEGDLLARLIPDAVQVAGSDSPEHKADAMLRFAAGEIRVLVSKPAICGFGMNFQSCARMGFVNVTHSYEQFYQAVRRCWRFGQTRPVQVHTVYDEREGLIIENLARKEQEAQELAAQMVAHMRFDADGEATGRESDGYHPHTQMILPAWLGGNA